jgi:hypothetical protein
VQRLLHLQIEQQLHTVTLQQQLLPVLHFAAAPVGSPYLLVLSLFFISLPPVIVALAPSQ